MERSVEVLAIILFGVIGLSHILQPKAWAEFFILLRGKGEAGAFIDGLLNLPPHVLVEPTPVVVPEFDFEQLVRAVSYQTPSSLYTRHFTNVSDFCAWRRKKAHRSVEVFVLPVGGILDHAEPQTSGRTV